MTDKLTEETEATACLHLDPETRENAVLRLKSAKGHLEGRVADVGQP